MEDKNIKYINFIKIKGEFNTNDNCVILIIDKVHQSNH